MNRAFSSLLLALAAIGTVTAQSTSSAQPVTARGAIQGGDQFLDGIGETALIARYQFNGDAEDSARNQLHATLRGLGGVFVEDGTRKALLLTGDGSHVQIPSSALAGEDALTVAAWFYVPTRASG